MTERIMKMAALGILATALVAALAACGGESKADALVTEACSRLAEVPISEAASSYDSALSAAIRDGVRLSDWDAAMNKECPEALASVELSQAQAQARRALPGLIDVQLTTCGRNSAAGSVINRSTVIANVVIQVRFEDRTGALLHVSRPVLNGLQPGQTREWEATFSGPDVSEVCHAELDGASAE